MHYSFKITMNVSNTINRKIIRSFDNAFYMDVGDDKSDEYVKACMSSACEKAIEVIKTL